MSKIKEAQKILKALGLPAAQQNEMSALTLLTLCGIKNVHYQTWSDATRRRLGVTKGIMAFAKKYYRKNYAPNTRETFRRQVLHQFVQARIADYNPDNPDLPVNSPSAHYAISAEALEAVKTFKTKDWKAAAEKFIAQAGELSKVYAKAREMNLIPVKLAEGKTIKLSAGKHNRLQAAIVEQFAPRFRQWRNPCLPGRHRKEKPLRE